MNWTRIKRIAKTKAIWMIVITVAFVLLVGVVWRENPNMQIALISPVMTLLIAGGAAYLTHRFSMSREIQLRDREGRHRVFSALMGQKRLLPQLYVSRFEALLFSDYHEERCRLTGEGTTSHDFEEAKRWMQKSEQLILEVTRMDKEVFETVGMALVLFGTSEELNTLANNVYNHAVPKVPKPRDGKTLDQLDQWKVEIVQNLQDVVCKEVGSPLQALIDYLRGELASDRE